MKWLREKMRNSYLAAKDRRAKGEKGGMEITTVIGLVIVAIVVLVIVKNTFIKTTNKATKTTERAIDTLYDNTDGSGKVETNP